MKYFFITYTFIQICITYVYRYIFIYINKQRKIKINNFSKKRIFHNRLLYRLLILDISIHYFHY